MRQSRKSEGSPPGVQGGAHTPLDPSYTAFGGGRKCGRFVPSARLTCLRRGRRTIFVPELVLKLVVRAVSSLCSPPGRLRRCGASPTPRKGSAVLFELARIKQYPQTFFEEKSLTKYLFTPYSPPAIQKPRSFFSPGYILCVFLFCLYFLFFLVFLIFLYALSCARCEHRLYRHKYYPHIKQQ